jgi:hypothetical protein
VFREGGEGVTKRESDDVEVELEWSSTQPPARVRKSEVHSTHTVVDSPTDRRTILVLAVVVLVVAVGAALALWPSGGDDPATPSTTTPSSATTTPSGALAGPPSTVATSGSGATASTVPGRPGGAEIVLHLDETGVGRPLLSHQSGLGVFVAASGSATGQNLLWRIDVDTSTVRASTGLLLTGDRQPLRSGNVLLAGDVVVLPDGTITPNGRTALLRDAAVYPTGDGSFWTLTRGAEAPNRQGSTTSQVHMQLYDIGGQTLADLILPLGASLRGVRTDGVLVSAFGRLAYIDLSGRAQPIGVGTIIGANGPAFVWVTCDELLRCESWAGDPTTPKRVRLDGMPITADSPSEFVSALASRIDPTGRYFLQPTLDSRAAPTLVDLRTGLPLPGTPNWVSTDGTWSPDGRYFLQIAGRTTPKPMLRILEVATGETAAAELPGEYFTQIGFVGALSTR